MRQARERVVLVHELRQLRGAEELLDRRHHGADVDQGLRGDRLDVLRGHALTDDALHAGQAGADLVLDQLADVAQAAVAEVVDVVDLDGELASGALEGRLAVVQRDDVLDRGDDVLEGQRRVAELVVETELAVDLVPADLGQVVALLVEVEVVQEGLGGLTGRRLARAQLAVDVEEGVVLAGRVVLLQGEPHRLVVAELLEDLGLAHAEGLEEDGDRLLALAVDAHADHVALVDLELQPGATARDDLGGVDVLVGGLVRGALEVDARAADELGDDDPLGAVDDEGAALGHEREVAHEHGLALDLARGGVHELRGDEQRGGVGLVPLLALVDGVLDVLEAVVAERQRHGAAEVLDRRDLLEDLLEAGAVRAHRCVPRPWLRQHGPASARCRAASQSSLFAEPGGRGPRGVRGSLRTTDGQKPSVQWTQSESRCARQPRRVLPRAFFSKPKRADRSSGTRAEAAPRTCREARRKVADFKRGRRQRAAQSDSIPCMKGRIVQPCPAGR